jgi:hypothetical protein
MTLHSTVRPPPRRRSARRIAAALLITLLLAFVAPASVDAYPCSYTDGGRIVSSDCAPPRPRREKHKPGEPNVVSLALFVAALAGVLLIPITYSRQGTADPK